MKVATQNVLHDVGRTKKGLILPQDKRIGSLAATLAGFSESIDVIGAQEVHKSKFQHNGEVMSETLGYEKGFWYQHNEKPYSDSPTGRAEEYVGLCGSQVEYADVIELGDNRRAVITVIDGVAYVTLHFRAGISAWLARNHQAVELTKALEPYKNAVLLLDANEPPIKYVARARDHLRKKGFRSVFELTGQSNPITHPVESYRPALSEVSPGQEGRFVLADAMLDDILVRGPRVKVLSASVLERVIVLTDDDHKIPSTVPREGSDHDGLCARLEIAA